MRLIFIGGPKHGQHEQASEAPARMWTKGKDGARTLYERRTELSYGVGDNPMEPYEARYAPIGMSDEELRRLEAEIKFDRDLE